MFLSLPPVAFKTKNKYIKRTGIRTRIRAKNKNKDKKPSDGADKAQVNQESRVESRLSFLGDQAGRTCGSSRLFHDLEVSSRLVDCAACQGPGAKVRLTLLFKYREGFKGSDTRWCHAQRLL